jgi:WXG100 protein secretion system (Wss), protein YukD
MALIRVTFINAGDDAELTAELNDSQTSDQTIQALIGADFIPALTEPTRRYTLTIKGRATVAEGQSLAAAGVQDGDYLRVNVAQRGGTGGVVR